MHDITPTFRIVLVAIADGPLTYHDLSAKAGISPSTAKRHLRDGREKGYMVSEKSLHSLTEKGKEAILHAPVSSSSSHTHVYAKARASKPSSKEYVTYVPVSYSHDDFRPGSMDAYKLPSRTLAGRVWP